MKHSNIQIIVKVTKDCNLRCKYCYIPFTEGRQIMTLETVENMTKKFASSFERVKFIWHGGEPLLAGVNFYKAVSTIQKKYSTIFNSKIENELQTNAALLNSQFYDFFLKEGFSVGLSADGPAEIQNISRPFKSGKGSFDIVNRNIQDINKTSIATGGVCVVSKLTNNRAKEMYQYYKTVGLSSMTLLPYMGKNDNLQVDNEEYFTFHQEVYNHWLRDTTPIRRVAPLTTIIKRLLGGEKAACAEELPICDYAGMCFYNFFTIDTNGDFLPCCAINKPVLGNINQQSIKSIVVSDTFKMLQHEENQLKNGCQSSCDYFFICKGGCRGASYLTYGDITAKDSHCEGKQRLFSYIQRDLEKRLKLGVD